MGVYILYLSLYQTIIFMQWTKYYVVPEMKFQKTQYVE